MAQSVARSKYYAQLVNKFPTFYGTRRFITVFTNFGHIPLLSQMNLVQTSNSCFCNRKFDEN
jgi:hypothetical protein